MFNSDEREFLKEIGDIGTSIIRIEKIARGVLFW